jgi:hypothetical protein
MTALARNPAAAPSFAEVFALRCWARAKLYTACAMPLHDAVDGLQQAAIEYGLVEQFGQDEVQRVMGTTFRRVREAA